MWSRGDEQVGKWRCSLKTWVGVCVWLSYRCQIHCVECFCGQKQSDRLNRMSLPMLPMNNLWHLVASERVVVHDSVDQSGRERRKSSENFSPIGSVQCCCLIDQSQHWIEWAENFFLLSRSPCWLIVSVNSPQWPRKQPTATRNFSWTLNLEPWTLTCLSEASCRQLLAFIYWNQRTSEKAKLLFDKFLHWKYHFTVHYFDYMYFLLGLSFFLLTITHPCLCFTVLRSVCHVVSDQSTVADTSSSDIRTWLVSWQLLAFTNTGFIGCLLVWQTGSVWGHVRGSVESCSAKGRPPSVKAQCPGNPSILSRWLSNEVTLN